MKKREPRPMVEIIYHTLSSMSTEIIAVDREEALTTIEQITHSEGCILQIEQFNA